jgi:hypothetical protein
MAEPLSHNRQAREANLPSCRPILRTSSFAGGHCPDALGFELLNRLDQHFLASRRNGDRGACFAQCLRDLQAQTAASARDQGHFTVEPKCVYYAH